MRTFSLKNVTDRVLVTFLLTGVTGAASLIMMVPQASYAVGSAADAMCAASQCTMQPTQGHPLCSATPCVDTTNGNTTNGFCATPTQCMATKTDGQGTSQALSQLGQVLGQLLGKLMQGSQSSASSPTTGSTGCTTSYYYTSNTSLIGVDPCAMYQPATTCTDPTASNYGAAATCTYGASSTSTTSANSLLSALSGSLSATTIGTNGDTVSASPSSGASPLAVTFTTDPIDSTQTYTLTPGDGGAGISLTSSSCDSVTSSTCVYGGTYTYNTAGTYTATLTDPNGDTLATVSVSVENPNGSAGVAGLSQVLSNVGNFLTGNSSSTQVSGQTSSNFPGVFGNILLNNGATIFASTINSSNNSETSGFYGAGTMGSQSQGMAGQLCQGRPWASNFLADIIPPSFFDSLCQWGGYQVGVPPAPQVTLQQQPQAPAPQPVATSTVATTTPSVPAQAEIWAVPSAVPLGARTSVFWDTQGVSDCTETSPDGSFSEDTLSGAASTVPLTGSTTFTISCVDTNGNPVTDYVTVNISS